MTEGTPRASREPPTARSIDRVMMPGTERSVSRLTLSVDPLPGRPPSLHDRSVALLRRARDLGVVTFDVVDSRSPELAERLLATAFPEPDPELGVIVGRSMEQLLSSTARAEATPPPSDPQQLLEESLGLTRRRLGHLTLLAVEWRAPRRNRDGRMTRGAPLWPCDSKVGRIIHVLGGQSLPEGLPDSVVASGALSLLETDLLQDGAATHGSNSPLLVARNPFADGRLDGTRFLEATLPFGPGSAPVDLRQLHEEFDPMLRLGFLTEGRRRTLAQAALLFVLSRPRVLTTVVPLPEPERLDEVLGFAAAPPLRPDELDRLGFMK